MGIVCLLRDFLVVEPARAPLFCHIALWSGHMPKGKDDVLCYNWLYLELPGGFKKQIDIF